MKSILKRITMIAVCLFGAIGMFLMGVITERKWAANRMQNEDRLEIEQMIADSVAQEEQPTIDINSLEFPERLGEIQQVPDVGISTPNQAGEDENEGQGGVDNQREPSVQPDRQNQSNRLDEVNRGIFIQLGAFENRSNAKKAVSIFSGRGFRAKIFIHNDSTNGLPFKVRLGPFENHQMASAIIAKLKQQNIPHFITHPSIQ